MNIYRTRQSVTQSRRLVGRRVIEKSAQEMYSWWRLQKSCSKTPTSMNVTYWLEVLRSADRFVFRFDGRFLGNWAHQLSRVEKCAGVDERSHTSRIPLQARTPWNGRIRGAGLAISRFGRGWLLSSYTLHALHVFTCSYMVLLPSLEKTFWHGLRNSRSLSFDFVRVNILRLSKTSAASFIWE